MNIGEHERTEILEPIYLPDALRGGEAPAEQPAQVEEPERVKVP